MLLLHRPRVPFLDNALSPDTHAIEALYLLKQADSQELCSLPNGAEASMHAADSLSMNMEAYQATYQVRRFPNTGVYFIFQAGTVHAGLASYPGRDDQVNSLSRMDKCIG
ncbi:hypothetical protein ACI68E_000958 [Malassezia pachydermatis]